jgi:hypothetical protein
MSKYESPVYAPLGAIAKGSGLCTAGSSVVAAACDTGAADAGTYCTCGTTPTEAPSGPDCVAGLYASRDCTAGTSANRDCTAGTCARATTCSAGGHVDEIYP